MEKELLLWFTPSNSCRFTFLLLSFPLTPHVMYSLRSLATGTKPEPLACCRSEAGQGSILLVLCTANATTWSHNAQCWRTFTDGRWHGKSSGTQADTVTQQRCTSAAMVCFIVNEYLLSSCAMPTHRGIQGGEPLVAEGYNQSLTQAAVKVKGSRSLHVYTCTHVHQCPFMWVSTCMQHQIQALSPIYNGHGELSAFCSVYLCCCLSLVLDETKIII